eukprot:356981-Chlamydomonas_euryale.AAC.10
MAPGGRDRAQRQRQRHAGGKKLAEDETWDEPRRSCATGRCGRAGKGFGIPPNLSTLPWVSTPSMQPPSGLTPSMQPPSGLKPSMQPPSGLTPRCMDSACNPLLGSHPACNPLLSSHPGAWIVHAGNIAANSGRDAESFVETLQLVWLLGREVLQRGTSTADAPQSSASDLATAKFSPSAEQQGPCHSSCNI